MGSKLQTTGWLSKLAAYILRSEIGRLEIKCSLLKSQSDFWKKECMEARADYNNFVHNQRVDV